MDFIYFNSFVKIKNDFRVTDQGDYLKKKKNGVSNSFETRVIGPYYKGRQLCYQNLLKEWKQIVQFGY